jgi:hypothetical protein
MKVVVIGCLYRCVKLNVLPQLTAAVHGCLREGEAWRFAIISVWLASGMNQENDENIDYG